MNIFRTCYFFILSSIASPTFAANLDWLKVAEPNILPATVSLGQGCTVSSEEVKDIVFNTIIRSRIKPQNLSFSTDKQGYSVILDCLPVKRIADKSIVGWAISLSANWIVKTNLNGNPWAAVDNQWGYTMWRTPETVEQQIKNDIKNATEDFLTDYIKVNYDL